MNINLNSVRDNVLNATVKVLTKAKSKPVSPGKTLQRIVDDPALTDNEKADFIISLGEELKANA